MLIKQEICKAKLPTYIDVSKVIAGNMEHNHESVSRQVERKVESTGKV